jgi:hypothetical protein
VRRRNHTGKAIRNVVNIGIGGCDLGSDGVRGAAPLERNLPLKPIRADDDVLTSDVFTQAEARAV